jgi:hypothetical protein
MRAFVMGDPQGPFAKVMAVLDRHGALAGDRLAPDVVLVSIGDHFDYDWKDPATCSREGLQLLRWLASHDPAQTKLVLGNHDASRVMELAALSDEEFTAARTCPAEDYAARYPHLPPQHVLVRDYASFTVEQRDLVRELLETGRFHLALVGKLGGREALITHAAVTTRELAMLGLAVSSDAPAIATALESHLELAVRRGTSPLSLEPLHIAGGAGREGGGLLYHRPSNPETGSMFDPDRPRRFDPRTLPCLFQVAGHSGHAKCVHELGDWCTWRAKEREHGGIRTLYASAEKTPTYDLGVDPDVTFSRGDATLILIDGELRRVPASEVDLLELTSVA